MYYTRVEVLCDPEFSEILMAEIAEAGFDTFMENENGFEAYADEKNADIEWVEAIKEKYKNVVTPLTFTYSKVDKQNWNEEWEKNVEPVIVDNKCLIRAEFHKTDQKFPYEIIITPKMSFGTGHHQTTYLMIKNQLRVDHEGKHVMDAGCGTAILSVMASKRGAKTIEAFDIDEWSLENGMDNARLNNCENIHIRLGTIKDFQWESKFDIILANINKNVLLAEMSLYATNLVKDGLLLLSGFYQHDIADLLIEAEKHGLKFQHEDERETWACLLLKKTI